MKITDAPQINNLAKQLGYKMNESSISVQIYAISNHPDHRIFVSTEDKTITGFIHGCKMMRLTSPTFWEICGLVVSKEHRRKGIGKKLVQHLEYAVDPNSHIRVRCNVKRRSAHLFYEDLDYTEKKEQKVFEK